MRVKARAKINLFLDVKGLRGDGYHEIITVMQPLELSDVLEISPLERDVEVICEDPEVPSGQENIVYSAGIKMKNKYNCHFGARIHVKKKIPVAAGLAGGSTDAAAAISALNRFWQINADLKELCQVAEMVGSDVPFCLLGRTALAQGRGEILTPLSPLQGYGVVLVKPPFGVSTSRVYSLYDSLSSKAEPEIGPLLQAVEKKDIQALSVNMYNALERVTIKLHPEIREIKEALKAVGASGALMSGSGPTVFGLFSDLENALAASTKLTLPGCRIIATETI